MNEIFAQQNLLILFRLITAHLLTDAIFRLKWVKNRLPENQWFSGWRLIQIITAGLTAYILVYSWDALWLPLTIMLSRTAFDIYKLKQDTVRAFTLNIAGHTAVILMCWLFLATDNINQLTGILYAILFNAKLWLITLSYILVAWLSGIGIGKITKPWREEIKKKNGNSQESQGLEKAGKWIGRLERTLILTFVLANHYEAIGFLIAAAWMLRNFIPGA